MNGSAKESQALRPYLLCAVWCEVCRALRNELVRLELAQYPLRWIDIEEHDEVLADLDISTLPTLVVTNTSGDVLFAGAVEPRFEIIERLLRNLALVDQPLASMKLWKEAVSALR